MDEIEPMRNGKRVERPGDIGEIAIYNSGPKTDWLNQGMVRSHNIIPQGTKNAHLFPVRGLMKMRKLCPAKFHRNNDRVFASWRSGRAIRPGRALSLLRMAVFDQGMNPTSFSLHSLRAGGATALYRATGNIELVDRMVRWGGEFHFSLPAGKPRNNARPGKVDGSGRPHFTPCRSRSYSTGASKNTIDAVGKN